ncbi:L,D-transpeptidase [Nocardioides bruguierae]|uniref:L,D-transpeptidase n=1 Tax=Nocardioides bruguierae TaxID=2945102 RepID=A0A9X2D5Q9_9ACTN|nr:L,D-transpeptidase [Nocardioides bruguierae]MCM0619337.1 L,D-transpeptidase [Nocardioides bruguierae]
MVGRHTAPVRPRWGRIGALVGSLALTLGAVLGAVGVLGSTEEPASAEVSVALDPAAASSAPSSVAGPSAGPSTSASTNPSTSPSASASAPASEEPVEEPVEEETASVAFPALPEGSGTGRRAVFSESEQRVWIVGGAGRVRASYLVSGSTLDNLDPGTYEVFSRSRDATGIDGSTMGWFVRFTRGPSGAAIGFHDLPVFDGERVQTLAQLGTPLSHGCIRQKRSDARVMWDFAQLGTTVVVTA